MRSKDINSLLQSNGNARDYFNTLPQNVKDALLAHGDGINTVEELKHFSVIMDKNGGKPYSM